MILGYEDFLNEKTIEIERLNNDSNFLDEIMKNSKKEKLLKYYVRLDNIDSRYRKNPAWISKFDRSFINGLTIDNSIVDMTYLSYGMLTHEGKYIEVAMMSDKEPYKFASIDPARILIVSDTPIDEKMMHEIFPENVKASFRNDIMNFTRKTKKNSITRSKLDRFAPFSDRTTNTREYRKTGSFDIYYLLLEYSMEKSKGEVATFDDAKKTKAFEKLMSKHPIEIVSTERQIKNGTFVFAIPSENIVDVKHQASYKKYLEHAWAIYTSGTILSYSMQNLSPRQNGQVGIFNSSSIEGWEKAFNIVDDVFSDYESGLKNRGIKILADPEERKNYRGYIAGHSFGI